MHHIISLKILGSIFGWVFNVSKSAIGDTKEDIYSAVKALARMEGGKLREFLAAVPIFVLFIRELVIRRKELGAQSELMVLGAGTVLGALLTSVVVAVMSSLAFQAVLLFTWPFIGIPLLLATSLTIFSVVVFLVWIMIFALNSTFSDNSVFIAIRDQFLPEKTRTLLNTIQQQVEESGANLGTLESLVSESLTNHGRDSSSEKIVEKLEKASKSKLLKRFEIIEECSIQTSDQFKELATKEEMKRKMKAESDARREKSLSKAGR